MLSAGSLLTEAGANLLAGIAGIPFVEQVADGVEAVAVAAFAVHAIVDGDEPHVIAGKDQLRVLANGQIISAEAGHILDDPAANSSLLDQFKSLLHGRAVEVGAGVAVIHKDFEIRVAMLLSISGQNGSLRRDLSRSVFAKQCAIRIDKQQKERYNNVVIDNDVII